MPVAEKPQHLRAFDEAQEVLHGRARQRRELTGAPVGKIVSALVDPSRELGSYKLETLFSKTAGGRGIIAQVGRGTVRAALREVERQSTMGRLSWHSGLRLDELTRSERQRVVRAIVKRAPVAWREGA